MNQIQHTDSDYQMTAGYEPLPGYHLLEPLGRGGFGEVWKCVAPGGLHKAVKFVSIDHNDLNGGRQSLEQEYTAFQQIKLIRHPFLLTLERVELVNDTLVMVMELADQHLQDRFYECGATGHAGVPREELVGYLAEAAEALDFISCRYALQHLDIKPANLFITSGHAKVGDYGLVSRFSAAPIGGATPGPASATKPTRGLTPRYVSPEVIRGDIDPRSDQYSLALVYFEMLTGQFPFKAKSAPQMLFQHATVVPDLSALPEADQEVVGRALAKNPSERYATCLDFIQGLVEVGESSTNVRSAAFRLQRPATLSNFSLPTPAEPSLPAGSNSTKLRDIQPTLRVPMEPKQTQLAPRMPPLTVVNRLTPPHLRVPKPRVAPSPPPSEEEVVELISAFAPSSPPPPIPAARSLLPPANAPRTQLHRIHSVMGTAQLCGENDEPLSAPSADEFTEALVRTLSGGDSIPRTSGDCFRVPTGGWISRILMKSMAGVVRLKLDALCETWGGVVHQSDPQTFTIRVQTSAAGMWSRFSGKKPGGLEVTIVLPVGGSLIGEAELHGRLFGTPDEGLIRTADHAIPKMMEDVRKTLQNVEDQRKTARVPTDRVVMLYPIAGDGTVFPAISAQCRDVSLGGIRFLTEATLPHSYFFVGFESIPTIAEWCLLTKVVRTRRAGGSHHEYAGRFRMTG